MPEIAPLGRRVAALCVDWALCLAVMYLVLSPVLALTPGRRSFVPLGLLVLLHVASVATTGSTPGHALLRLRVGSLTTPHLTPRQALVRGLLLGLIIPPVVVGADGRGMHDRLAGTVIVDVTRPKHEGHG